MALSLYEVSVPVYRQLLKALLGVLDKGEKHCADKGIDPASMLGARLFEDMLPLAVQVALAVDHSLGGLSRVRGKERARPSGLETFAGAKQAVEDALAELEAITQADLEGAESRTVELKLPGRELKFTGLGYLQSFAMPQFYFHVTTAYAILRHKGVPIGKRDFLGRVQLANT
jgi:uncharacterized protein